MEFEEILASKTICNAMKPCILFFTRMSGWLVKLDSLNF